MAAKLSGVRQPCESPVPSSDLHADSLFRNALERAGPGNAQAACREILARLRAAHAADTAIWLREAENALRAGFPQVAENVLTAALERFPGQLSIAYRRGNALRIVGRKLEAEQDFRAELAAAPDHREAAFSLAHMLREDGRLSAAAQVIETSLRACTDDWRHTIAGLDFLRECGAHAIARSFSADARKRWPDNAGIAALDAQFAAALGDFDGARSAARSALDINPSDGQGYLLLAHCQRFTARDDPDLRRIENAWRNRALDDHSRTAAGFALGKALIDLGERAEAVDVLREANAAASRRAAWRAAEWREFVGQQVAGRALPQVEPPPDFIPVFMVGLPRTGTTLAASLLARDGRLRDRGELNWIDAMYHALQTQGRLHDWAALSSAARIVAAQLRRDDPPARWYLDKNPLNFRYLNLIVALFPNAKIIHCRRNMRDTALSLWTQHFAHVDLGFSYDFSDIAAFVEGYHEIVSGQWRNVPLEVFDLHYESLVTQPAETLRQVRGFLGLQEPEGGEGTPHEQVVTTASVWQVRQPLYQSSIGRWVDFAEYLPELTSLFPD